MFLLIYVQLILLNCRHNSHAYLINVSVLTFLVAPCTLYYFTSKNFANIGLVFETQKLPEAKSSGFLLTLFYYLFVIGAFFNMVAFLVLWCSYFTLLHYWVKELLYIRKSRLEHEEKVKRLRNPEQYRTEGERAKMVAEL